MAKRKKVAIVARHPKSRYQAPFDDDDFDIWTMSPFPNGDQFTDLPRWDLFFEIHDEEHLEKEVPGAWAWLKSQDAEKVVFKDTIYLGEVASIVEGVEGREYSTCTPAFCIAYAVKLGYEEIHLYGCDMATDSEYAYERPCVEFWLGYAAGHGCKVVLPSECDLCNSPQVYGFGGESHYLLNIRARGEELKQRMEQAELELEKNRAVMAASAAVLGELTTIMNHDDPDQYIVKRREEVQQGMKQVEHDVMRGEAQTHMLQGCISENEYHRKLV